MRAVRRLDREGTVGARGSTWRRLAPHGAFFFVYGAAVHEALLAWAARHEYGSGSAPAFLRGPTVPLIAGFNGGLFVALLFLPLLVSCYGTRGRGLAWKVLLGGLYGIGATFLAVAGSSVAGGVLLIPRAVSQPAPPVQRALLHSWLAAPFIAFFGAMEIATYAGGPIVYGIPLEFAYGVGGALYALAVTARVRSVTERGERLWGRGTLSLVLGGLGVLFISITYVSVPLGVFAVAYGIMSGAWGRRAGRRTIPGRVGTALGVICVLWFLYGIAVYQWASRLARPHHP